MRVALGLCPDDECQNGMPDPDESDLDCGGSCGLVGIVCADGQLCGSAADCVSLTSECGATTCSDKCTNGTQNSPESDVDCGGGRCPKCGFNDKCDSGDDCESGVCPSDVCQ